MSACHKYFLWCESWECFSTITKYCSILFMCVIFSVLCAWVTGWLPFAFIYIPSCLFQIYEKQNFWFWRNYSHFHFIHRLLVLLTWLVSNLAFPFFQMLNTSCVLLHFLILHSWRITFISKKKHLITGSWHSFWKKINKRKL